MNYSSQHHSFDISIAAKYGVEEAILIHHFMHWIRINTRADRNLKEFEVDGQKMQRYFTYQSRKDIQLHFPYWNFDRVKYLCEKLVSLGVLFAMNFNKSLIDNTLWYAFVNIDEFNLNPSDVNKMYDNSISVYEGQKCPTKGKSAQPIPDTKATDTLKKNEEREPQAATAQAPSIAISQKIHPKKKKLIESKIEVAPRVWITPSQASDLEKRLNGTGIPLTACYDRLSRWYIQKNHTGDKNDYSKICEWVIGAMISDKKNVPADTKKEDEVYAKTLEHQYPQLAQINLIQVFYDRVEFLITNIPDVVKFGDANFKGICESYIRKLNTLRRW